MSHLDLDPKLVWLFCMTHPDDEISVAGCIHRLVNAGSEVWISWTHDTAVRQAEARGAAHRLGVPESRLFFHQATDGKVIDELARLLPIFKAMVEAVKPDRVVCGAFEQGHLDHDATNLLVNSVFQGTVHEAPFYHTYLTRMPRVARFADPSGEEVIPLTPEERRVKIDLSRAYPSQRIALNMLMADLRARLTGDGPLADTERLRVQTHRDFTRPNLPAPLAQRVEQSERWQRWRAAVDRFLATP